MFGRKFIENFSPVLKLIFDILITLIVFAVFMILGTFFILKIYNLEFDFSIFTDTSDINRFMLLQAINTISLFLLPPFFIAIFNSYKPSNYLGLDRTTPAISFLMVFLIIIFMQPIISTITSFTQSFDFLKDKFASSSEYLQEITNKMLSVSSVEGLLRNLIIIALIPAFGEELFFRGILQKRFIEITKSADLGIFITAMIFSFFHFDYVGFLARLILGITLGYIYFWSKSIYLSAFAHFSNNALAVVLYWFYTKKGLNIEELSSTTIEDKSVYFYAILAVFIVYFLMNNLKKQVETNDNQ